MADAPPSPDALRADLEQQLSDLFDNAQLGEGARFAYWIADAQTGRPIAWRNESDPMRPASLLKVLTAAAVMDVVGPNRTFPTVVEASVPPNERQVVEGHLRLKGGGDPSFGPRFQADRNDHVKAFRDFARAIRRAGIKRVEGDVLFDDTLFEDDRQGLGWDRSERAEWYSAEVSALSYNDNTVDLLINPSSSPNRRASVRVFPKTDYVVLVNDIRSAPEGLRNLGIRYRRNSSGREIVASGYVDRRRAAFTDWAAVGNPGRFAATVFQETLRDEGVEVTGNARSFREIDPSEWSTTASITLATATSPPVSTMLPVVLGISQNLYAEVLLRHLAIEMQRPPSFRGGSEALMQWLRDRRLDAPRTTVVDGSGLSPLDRITARQVGQTLLWVHRQEWAPVYESSLAHPGLTGSLRSRFVEGEGAALRKRLRAKTGFISGVQGLAGFLVSEVGNPYVVVLMVDDSDKPREVTRDFVDAAMILVASHPSLP